MTERADITLLPNSADVLGESATIAFYFYSLAAPGGGAERMVCQLAGGMARRGFTVQLLTWDEPQARSYYPIDAGVHWHRLGFAPGLGDKLRRIRALRDVLQASGTQVLVGFVISGDRTVYAAARLAGVRLVAAERNAPQMYRFRYGPLQRWLAMRLLGLADRITVQMPGFAACYPARLRARIVSIPNPVPLVNHIAAPATPDAKGHFTLLAASRLDAGQKRIACLVDAFARVAADHPAWQLRIVGDGPERDRLQQRVAVLGLASRVTIAATTRDIFDVYASSHLFAIPSRWEGFSNALAEAMAHGLPAVGFAHAAGVAELIGSAGWLADGLDDDAALADALGRAMADGQQRQRRGELARQQMARFGTAEQQFDRWAWLLSDLARGSAGDRL